MIRRSLAKALQEQNWIALGLDFLIVVLGIFVGLQVNNWNEARKDRMDEQLFLTRLHGDIVLAEGLSSRVRDRRLGLAASLIDASDVLFGRVDRNALNDETCKQVASVHFFNIPLSDLPSLAELISSGRMAIIQNTALRTALVELQQTKAALAFLINIQVAGAVDLPSKYPGLIQLETYFDSKRDEVRFHAQCDLMKMRKHQEFLNDYSENVDRYDAYTRDGLSPWSAQFDVVHHLVDDALAIQHGEDDVP